MRTNPAIFLLLAATTALAAAGCHSREPQSPEVGLRQPADPPKTPDLGRGPPRGRVELLYSMYVDDPVRLACKGPDPFFRFDSSKTTGEDQATMQTLVHCMQDGALRGRSIVLVGRTDPRGTEDYNDKLGLERAERVKRYLVTNGIEEGRVKTISLGKDDASPFPTDWQGDRRVEVMLAK